MKYTFLISLFIALSFFETGAQTKSLRKIILKSNIIALIEPLEEYPLSSLKILHISDHEKNRYIDSIKVIEYLKGKRTGLEKQKIIVRERLDNAFVETFWVSPILIEVNEDHNPDNWSTIVFCKKERKTLELIFSVYLPNREVNEIREFLQFVSETEKLNSLQEKAQTYINKYIQALRDHDNILASGEHLPEETLRFFEDILSSKSDFTSYYTSQNVNIILTDEQKEILKEYAFRSGKIFDRLYLLKMLYEYSPSEVIDFVQVNFTERYLSEESTLLRDSYSIEDTLEFLLSIENKLTDANKLQLDVINSYRDEITLEQRMEALRFLLEQLRVKKN